MATLGAQYVKHFFPSVAVPSAIFGGVVFSVIGFVRERLTNVSAYRMELPFAGAVVGLASSVYSLSKLKFPNLEALNPSSFQAIAKRYASSHRNVFSVLVCGPVAFEVVRRERNRISEYLLSSDDRAEAYREKLSALNKQDLEYNMQASSSRIADNFTALQEAQNARARDHAYAVTAISVSEYLEFHNLLKDVSYYQVYKQTGSTPILAFSLTHVIQLIPYAAMYIPMVFLLGPAINRYVMLRALSRHLLKRKVSLS